MNIKKKCCHTVNKIWLSCGKNGLISTRIPKHSQGMEECCTYRLFEQKSLIHKIHKRRPECFLAELSCHKDSTSIVSSNSGTLLTWGCISLYSNLIELFACDEIPKSSWSWSEAWVMDLSTSDSCWTLPDVWVCDSPPLRLGTLAVIAGPG